MLKISINKKLNKNITGLHCYICKHSRVLDWTCIKHGVFIPTSGKIMPNKCPDFSEKG